VLTAQPKIQKDKEARGKLFTNSIRLSLGHLNKFKQRTDGKAIYAEMVAKFGSNSCAVKGITGIAPHVDQSWIIAYGIIKVPEKVVSSTIKLNDCDVKIEDASIEASVYETERLKAAERLAAEAKRVMTFRVQGLPLDVRQNELFDVLNGLGFGIEDMNKVRQMYDNFGGQLIRNGIVLFRVSCSNKERQKLLELLGEHQIELSEIHWKIKINCFGFCVGCKKEGHIASKCPEKVVSCYYCRKGGHEKKDCPELSEKKNKSTCFKCRQSGHFSRECPNRELDWNLDLADYPSLPENNDSKLDLDTNNVTQSKQTLPVVSSFSAIHNSQNLDGLSGLFGINALVVHNQGTTPSNKRNPENSPEESMLRKKPVVLDGDHNMDDLSESEDEKDEEKEAN